ncbi:tetraspanin-13-like isoform X1 [Acanthaster planci]|uniref:Tetraspanin-13-like isoform X1 n=1 Tax=Acanthaster planci TaxID=133434 RepID=A0A8B7XNZ5_ACAPL|nr:tetraspanin-13-like isoform X1 [Acanthaster planci]
MCGGFTCSRNALIALNSLYIIVALILIIVPPVAKSAAYVSSMYIVGGIIACGIFLFAVAIIGLVGALKHHQVCLFFYMVILFLVFLIQFSVSIACLALGKEQRGKLVKASWKNSSNGTKSDIQKGLDCCGFDANDTTHPSCHEVQCCKTGENCSDCKPCKDKLDDVFYQGLHYSGGVGLFFSFTELIGVWLAVRYRNQKDPRANPSAFL